MLNADYRPLSYFPLSLWSWQDAIKAVFLDRVNIVSEYERVVRSPVFEMRLPSVVSLKTYVKPTRNPAFTRFNVFLRDRFTVPILRRRTTISRSITSSRARKAATRRGTMWSTACAPCNLMKGGQLPQRGAHVAARRRRYRPTVAELHNNGRLFPPNYLHQSWQDYLYWDTELEP